MLLLGNARLLLQLDKPEKQEAFEDKFEKALDVISLTNPTDEMFSLKANLYGIRLKTANVIEGIRWKAQALYCVEKAFQLNANNYRAILAECYVKLFTKSADPLEIKGRLNAAIHIIENNVSGTELIWGKDLCYQLMAFTCKIIKQDTLAKNYLEEAISLTNALKLKMNLIRRISNLMSEVNLSDTSLKFLEILAHKKYELLSKEKPSQLLL